MTRRRHTREKGKTKEGLATQGAGRRQTETHSGLTRFSLRRQAFSPRLTDFCGPLIEKALGSPLVGSLGPVLRVLLEDIS